MDNQGGLPFCIDEKGQATRESNYEEVPIRNEINANTSQITIDNTYCYATNEAKSEETTYRILFQVWCKGHFASQCPSRQVNTMLYDDPTSDEEPLSQEAVQGVKNYNTQILNVAFESDPNVDVLSLQIVPKNDTKVDKSS